MKNSPDQPIRPGNPTIPFPVAIDRGFAALIPPLSDEEFDGLRALIAKAGRATDALKTWNGILLDGHNRLRICQELKLPYWTEEIADLKTRTDAEIWIILHQFGRRNLSPYTRGELALKLKPRLEAQAKERQAAAGASFGRGHPKVPEKLPEAIKPANPSKKGAGGGETRDHVAKVAGMSGRQIDKVEFIAKKATADQKARLHKGETTITKVERDLKNKEREQFSRDRQKETTTATCTVDDLMALLGTGTAFGCIYADPPWLYDNQGTRAATGNHYSGLTIDQLCALPIGRLAAKDAHLHLWITNGFLFDAPRIFAAWGFEFRSSFIWVKTQMGIGNYWRNSHEILLTGIRGNAKSFNDHSLRSWLECDRGKHSAKPEQVRGMIERASPGPYLELFGRRPADRWTVWGNEIEKNLFHTGQAVVA